MSKRTIIGLALLVIFSTVFWYVNSDVDKQDNMRYARQKAAEWERHAINTPSIGSFTLASVPDKKFGAVLSVKGTATSEDALKTLKSWIEEEFPTFRVYEEYKQASDTLPGKVYRLVKYEVEIDESKEEASEP